MGIHIYTGLDKIYYLDSFERELSVLTKNNPKYAIWLERQLEILNQGAKAATNGYRFEPLENCDFYAIRHVSKLNERVIYYIIEDDDSVILLGAFYERNKSDYHRAVNTAKKRLQSLREEFL